MFPKNSKPLWKHVFSNTCFLCFYNYFRWEQNHKVTGVYINNNYKNEDFEFKTKQVKDTEHRKKTSFLKRIGRKCGKTA